MFDKRLLAMVAGAKKFIAANVVLQWVALLANVVMMMSLGLFIESQILGDANLPATVMLGISSQLMTPTTLIIIAIVAIVIRVVCTLGAQRASVCASTEAKSVIRTTLYEKFLRMGTSYTDYVSTSEATQVSVEGVEQLDVYFGSYMPQFFYAVLAPVTLFVCLAPLSLPAAIVLLVCVPLIPASIMAFQKIAKRLMKSYWGSYTDLGGTFLENIQGLTTLKIYQADAQRHERMNAQAENFRQATMRVLRMQLNSVTIMDVLAYGGAAIGIIIVMAQFAAGHIGFAAAFAIVFLSADFFLPMRALGSLFHTAMNGMAAADRMFELLATPEPAERTESVDGLAPSVTAQGLGYSYDGERQVLHDVDLAVSQGEFVAIVGESGCGKSTLAGVMSGRNSLFTGDMRICGVPIERIDRASLARVLVTVGYDARLFKGTVRENLLMGLNSNANANANAAAAATGAQDERLWEALEKTQVAAFIRANGGLDMPIAEDASNISGGQRQRIVLARALLADAPLYIFDEATSSIDPASEQAVMAAIHTLVSAGKTVIMISHRLSNVVDADTIYAMADGTIAERGTHAELLAAGGVYARLVEQQNELEAFAAHANAQAQVVHADDAAASADADGAAAAAAATDAADANAPTTAAAPAATPAPQMHGLRIMGRMIGLVKPLAGYMVIAVVLGIVGFLCAIGVTVVGAQALAHWAAGGSQSFALLAIIVAVVAVLRGPLHYGEQICNHYIAFRLLALIRDRVFAALRRLAPAKLEGRDKGNLISLVTADIELLEVFYAHTISPVIIAIVVSVVMVVAIGTQSLVLAVFALVAYVVIGIVVPRLASLLQGNLGIQLRESMGSMNTFVLESLRGLAETIQFGQANAMKARLTSNMNSLASATMKQRNRGAWATAITYALVLAFDTAIVCLAASQVAQGCITAGQACACVAILMSSYGPVIAIANLGTTLQSTLASGARVLSLLDEQPETPDVVHGANVNAEEFSGATMTDVSFSYAATTAATTTAAAPATPAPVAAPATAPASAAAPAVLAHIDLDVRPGQVVRIAGKSGSGKSTLCKLLMRFWSATSGTITVSDTDINSINTASLRDLQSYMTQDTYLFEGTLRDNIALARPAATEAQIAKACDQAALGDLIARLPHGLDTQVGELAASLSGGERQRIGLARVFLHDVPFVLLDEPTSNLDALNEAAVLRAVQANRAGKTIVLVSHRESTGALADTTITIERGRVS